MPHQILTIPPSPPSPLRSSLLPRWSHSCCLVEEQATMEVLEEEEEVVRAVEAGNFFLGEEFSVDDLLNLEFVGNVEEEEEADGDGGEVDDVVDKKEMEVPDSSSVSSNSSTVSFEPPLVLPAHDAEEFEWVSLIMDESPSEFPSCSGVVSSPSATQSLGDVGTLTENSTGKSPLYVSSSVCILLTEPMVPVKAKRSKRSRSTTAAASAAWFTPGPLFLPQSTSGSSSSSFLTHDHQHAGAAQSFPPRDSPPQTEKQKPKKCGRKPKSSPCLTTVVPGERCCAHCGAQKTPQWRAGPLGNKTLCNACGVRFKSGRLLPEYRPAGSPTFVSCIHSNCHRKVLEMRRNKEAPPPVPSFQRVEINAGRVDR